MDGYFFRLISPFLLDYGNTILVAINSKLRQQPLSSWFSELIWKFWSMSKRKHLCSLNGYICSLNYIECWARNEFCILSTQSNFFNKHMSFGYFFLGPYQNHEPLKCKCPNEESDQIRAIYLLNIWILGQSTCVHEKKNAILPLC